LLSEKGINGIIVNQALSSLHGWFLEITFTVPFKELRYLPGGERFKK